MTDLVLIAAVARNGVIGRDNGIPFRLPSDLKRFKATTMGHPVLMGRLTFESIGKPLPGRPTIIVSGDPDYTADGCEVLTDLKTALDRGRMLASGLGKSALFVLGGGHIYAQTIDQADRLDITHVQMDADGSVTFPSIDPAIWSVAKREFVPAGPNDDADMVFVSYRRGD